MDFLFGIRIEFSCDQLLISNSPKYVSQNTTNISEMVLMPPIEMHLQLLPKEYICPIGKAFTDAVLPFAQKWHYTPSYVYAL